MRKLSSAACRSFHGLLPCILSLIVAQLTCSTTCTQKHLPGGGRITLVNPFKQWLAMTGDTAHVTLHPNSLPVELGYSFIASDTGTIYQIGLRLPDTGRTYTVSLWDGVTQGLLVQKNIKNAGFDFTYADLTATSEVVHIQANRNYVISVNMIPVGLAGAGPVGDNFYDVERTDRRVIFPMTESYITYQYQYSKTTYTPAFPDNLTEYQDIINGICDIGFSHVSQ